MGKSKVEVLLVDPEKSGTMFCCPTPKVWLFIRRPYSDAQNRSAWKTVTLPMLESVKIIITMICGMWATASILYVTCSQQDIHSSRLFHVRPEDAALQPLPTVQIHLLTTALAAPHSRLHDSLCLTRDKM